MNTQGECAKCHVPMEVGYAFYFPRWRWLCAAKLVPGKAEIELLDGSRGEERSKRPHHNASLPKLWVFGVVRNQTRCGWRITLFIFFRGRTDGRLAPFF